MYCSRKLRTVYIHCKKTAGTSITQYLQAQSRNIGTVRRRHITAWKMVDWIRRFEQHADFPTWFWWATIRHPMARWHSQVRHTRELESTKHSMGLPDLSERTIWEHWKVTPDRAEDDQTGGTLISQSAQLQGLWPWCSSTPGEPRGRVWIPIHLVAVESAHMAPLISQQFGVPFTQHHNRTSDRDFVPDPEVYREVEQHDYYQQDIELWHRVCGTKDWYVLED